MPVMQELDLHLRHVDARRAIAAASLAAHAQVEGFAHRLGCEVRAQLARQRQAQRIRAAARQMHFVARDAVTGAHRARVEFARLCLAASASALSFLFFIVGRCRGLGEPS